MSKNSEFFLGDENVKLIKLGSENVKIYLGDALVYSHGIDISTATVTCASRTYTGNPLVANSITVILNGVTLVENTDYTVTTNAGGTNVGTYSVVITGIGQYFNTANGTFSITKAVPVYTAPTANNSTYSGSAINLLVAGSTSHGTIQYSSDNNSWNTTIPTGTNANTYTSYWRLIGDSNHSDINSTSISTTIAKANPVYTAPTNNNPTYTGNAVYLMTSGSTAHGTIQYSSDNSSYGISIPTAINAGSYDRYWRLVGDSNHNDVSSTKVTCSIATAAMTNVVNPTATSLTYSGSAQNLLNAGSATGGTWYYSNDDSSWSTSIPTGTNAGDYTSYAKLVADSNHKGDIASFSIGTNIARHSINPTVSLSGWTYGATANNPSVSGNSGSGSVTYYYKVNGADDSTYTTTKPSNAGSYVVKAEIAQTTNYLAGSATNTFSISKANLNASVSMNNWTYGGTASTPSVSGNSGSGTVTYYYKVSGAADSTYTTTKPSNAGSYIVRADIASTTNYNAATVTNTFSINKANLNASVSLSGWTYGATANNPSVSGNSGSGTVTYSYKVSGADDSTYTSTKPSNAGSYVVKAVIAETANYNGATVTNTFSIAKANISPSVSMANWTYGGTASTPSVSGNSGSGSVTYSYKVSGADDSTYSSTKPSNAGTYTIKAVIAETSNYNGGTATNGFTINKANLSASVSMSNWTYGDTASSPSVTGNSGSGSVTYSYKVSGAADSTYSSTKPSNAGDYVVRAIIAETSNYNGTTVTNTFSIAKAAPSYTAPTKKTLTYNGSDQALLNAGSTSHGTISYSSDGSTWSSSIPTGKNATDYNTYWKLDGDSNHTSVSSTKIVVTISKVTPTVTIPTAKVLTYNTSAQALVNAGSTNFGTLKYSLDNSTWSTSVPTATNYGSYTVYYKVDGDSNINSVASASVACSISEKKVTATVTVSPTSYTYSGSNCEPTVTVKDGSVTIPASEYTVTYSNNKNAGTATVTITDNVAGNYEVTGSATFTINRANLSASVSMSNWTYGGTASTPSVSGNSGNGSVTYSYKVKDAADSTYSSTKPSAAGNYTVRAVIDQTTNYNGTTVTSNFTINKANLNASVSMNGWTYGGSATSPSVSGNSGSGSVTYTYKVNGAADSTYTSTKPSNAGTYVVRAVIAETSNYNGATVTNTFTIAKANGSVTINGVSLSYNGSSRNLATVSGATGTMHYGTSYGTWSTSIPTSTNAGSWNVYWYMDESANYNGISASSSRYVSSSISKIDPTYTAPTAKTGLTYNGSSQTLYNAGSNTTAGSFSYSDGTRTNAGSQTVSWTFTPTDTTNYNTKSGSFSVTIAQATGSASVSGVTTNYTGSAQNMVSVSGNTGTMHYRVGTSGSWTTTIPTRTNAGSDTIYFYMDSSTNYTARGSSSSPWSSVTGTVNKINPTYSAPTAKSGLVYNGSAQTLYNAGSNTTAGSFSYSDGSRTNAGSQTVSWSFTPTDTTNYNSASGSFTGSIAKANGSVSISGVSLSYNGSSRNLVSVSGNTGTMHYATSYGTWSTSIPTSTNVGSWTIYWYMDESTNYNAISASTSRYVSSSISKIDPTYTAPTAKSGLTYSGSAQYLYNAGSNTTAGSFSYSNGTRTDAGSQTVSWTFTPTDTTNYNTKSGSFTGTIGQATGSASVSGRTVNYSGSAQNMVSVSGNTGTMYYRVGTSGSWTTTIPTRTNAGSDTIYYYMDSSTNYTARGSSSSPWGNVTGTVNKIDPTYSAPTAKTNLTYNGSSQTLYNAGSNTTAGSFSYSNGTRTDAGSQTVSWTFTPTDTTNYNSASGSFTGSIDKASGSAYATANSWTYNGTAYGLVYNAGGYGTLQYQRDGYSWSTSIPTVTDAGSYNCRVYSPGDSNHYEAYSGWYTCTVSKASGSVSISGVSVTYNGNSRSLASVSGATGTMHYSTDYSNWSTTIPSATNAGSWTIYWYMDASANYNSVGASTSRYVSSSIAKADQSAPTAYGASVVYGNTATASTSGGGGVGSIEWSNGSTLSGNVGSKTTYARWTGNSNYNASGWSNAATLSITQASGSVSISGVSLSYNGSSRSLASVSGNTGTMHYSTDYSNWSTSIPTATNAGSWTIYWYMDASINYTGIGASTSRYVSSSIAKIDPTITAAPTNANPTYNGSAQYLLTGGTANVSGSFGYSTGTDAGSYTASWTFYPSDSTNYNNVSGSVAATIAKASGSAYATANGWTYNGTAYGVVYSAGGYGSLQYRLEGGSWSTSVPTATNAGTYKCQVYSSGDSNHNEAYSGWYTCTVNKADQSAPTASGATTTYGTTAYASASGGGGVGSLEWSNGSSRSTAGSQTTKARWSGNGNYNASAWSNEVTLTVNKANPSYTAPTAKSGLVYSGSAQTLYNAGSNTTAGSFSYTNGSRTAAGSQTVSWSFTPTDSTNYNGASGSFTGSIDKATQSAPTAYGATVTYGSTATATTSGGGGVGSIEWSNGSTRTTAGSQTTKARWTGNDNYYASAWSNEVTLLVNKANPSYTAPTAKSGLVYNGSSQTLYNAGSNTTAGSFSYTNGTRTAAGSQTVSWSFTPTDTTNYNSASGSFTGSIDKATQSAPTAYGSTVTYGSTATASASGGGGVGSIEWSNGSSRSATGSQNTQARWTGNDNYYASSWSNTVTLTVNKANPSYTAPSAKTGLVYNGSSQTLYNAGSNTTAGSFSYSNGTRTSAGTQTVSWSFTPTDTTNYNSASGSFNVTIAQATGSVSFTSAPTSVSIGNTVSTAISYTGDGSISYSSSDTNVATIDSSGVITGVGNGTATITVSLSSGINYTGASASYNITSVFMGVGILYSDGSISDSTTLISGKTAVGPALGTEHVSIVKAIYTLEREGTYNYAWTTNSDAKKTLIDGVSVTSANVTSSWDPGLNIYDGLSSTNTMLNNYPDDTGAFYQARYHTRNSFPDGRLGYLPATGEIYELLLNLVEVDKANNTILGYAENYNNVYRFQHGYHQTESFWSATQYSGLANYAYSVYNKKGSIGQIEVVASKVGKYSSQRPLSIAKI